MSNISGHGEAVDIPPAARGWSVGAFVYGIYSNLRRPTWRSLLVLVPFVNVVVLFKFGLEGRELAWRHRRWRDVAHFERVQRRWSLAVLVPLAVLLTLYIAMLVLTRFA